MLDSLVRVSRRVKESHFVRIQTVHAPEGAAKRTVDLGPTLRQECGDITITPRCDQPSPHPNPAARTHPDQLPATATLPKASGKMTENHTDFLSFPFSNFRHSLTLFSNLRWNLPPTLSCNPKQLDSLRARRTQNGESMNGTVTLSGALFQGT
eukprot:56926-Eustigmatos_ZCMA.PRE.4